MGKETARETARDAARTGSKPGGAPLSLGMALLTLFLLYVLIGGPVLWKVRRICLLQSESCGVSGMLEFVLAEPLVLGGSVLMLSVLSLLSWHIIRRALDGTLGVEIEEPASEPRFRMSGLPIAVLLLALSIGGSLLSLTSAATSGVPATDADASLLGWKIMGPAVATLIVWTLFWHVNDYFEKPVSNVLLLLFFLTNFGTVYLFQRTMAWG